MNALINCHLLTGRIGRPGMGPFSITGQPNAMGGREVGALSNTLAAHMDFALEDVGRVGRFWGTNRVPRRAGLKAVELFEAVGAGRIKAIWIMATNPVASLPDADAVRAALRACDLSIVSEVVRASDTVDACRIRLPALAWAEKDGTVTNSERGISRQRRSCRRPARRGRIGGSWPRSRAGWAMARPSPGRAWPTSSASMRGCRLSRMTAGAISTSAPMPTIDDGAYESMAPFVWPAPQGTATTDARPDKRFFGNGGFFHSDGRARFVATASRPPVHAPSSDWPIRLNTGRVRDQWHTMTRTAKSPRLAGHRPEPTIELNAIDAAQRGLQDGDIAEVSSAWGRATLRVHLSTAVRQGEAFAPMHWTAQLSRAGRINAAVNPAVDPISGQPELKHTPVEIRRVAVQWHGTILARRPIMLPEVAYWARIRGVGCHAWLLAGEQPLPAARRALAAAMRTANPGPWLDGENGLGAVISDGRLEAVLSIGKAHDEAARDRLAPFMAMVPLDSEQRRVLLQGGQAAADRGGEVCACLGVSVAAVQAAIADGAMTLDAVGAVTKAGTSCGSCRPEIRALLRAARPRRAA